MISDLGTVTAGSTLVAMGRFTGGQTTEMVWKAPDGSCFLWVVSGSGTYHPLPVAMPPGYNVVGVEGGGIPNQAANTVLDPGTSQLLLENAAGDLAYGSFYMSATGSGLSVTPIGSVPAGSVVKATGNYNIANYFGDGQILLQTNQDTLTPFNASLSPFTAPNGFTIVPNSTGNDFGSDLPATLFTNASGTVEALLEGGTVVTQGQPTAVAISAMIGTLQPNQTIVAAGGLNSDGSTNILLRQGPTLEEWIVSHGTIAQRVSLTMPGGFSVSGMAAFSGTAGLVLTDAAGDVVMIGGTTASPPAATAFPAGAPAIVLDGNYNVLSGTGVDATLSDDLAELAGSVPLSAIGVRVLTIQQGALSNCSYEQVVAGNLTLAAWEQNVATLNAIAAACRRDGITVQVETRLGRDGNFGAAQTYQWLNPALAAGLPIGYVEDNQEFPNWTALNIPAMAAAELRDIEIIHACLPNAVFGEWEQTGAPDPAGTITAYHAFLQNWYTTLKAAAEQQGLPGISYIIADQYFSPILTTGATVSATGQDPGADVPVNAVASLVKDARAVGVQVELLDAADDTDLNPLQALARQELAVSQEATLDIAAIQVSEAFNQLPVSNAVNMPGATYNAAAELAAITPLYRAHAITTTGAVKLALPSQAVVGQGAVAALAGLSVSAGASDQASRLAVVLIAQTATLSATPFGTATVGHGGANTLILNGTPADVAAELASLTIDEPVAGPDSIDVEAFGNAGRVAGGTITVLATGADGATTYTPSPAGVLPQLWTAASAIVNNGVIVSEGFTWNAGAGLAAAGFIGGSTIAPVTDIRVDQPLLQGPLPAVGASYPAAALAWHPANSWAVYGPLNASTTGTLAAEPTSVGIAASQLSFDPLSGQLLTETDTIVPALASVYASLPQFADPATPYYFAGGGLAVTQYHAGAGVLYDGGASAITVLADGPDFTIADGSTGSMLVGSIQTIYGIVNGATRVVEVRYLGAASNPYDEVDQVFNPYSATPQLWQQINTVGIPVAMAGSGPLPLPSAATVTEYNTGNNPNWSNTLWIGTDRMISTAGDQIEAVTTENGNWDSAATVAANGVAGVFTGVTWIGEGAILNAYTLAAPTIQGWTAGQAAIAGTGIAGDRVVLTGSDGTLIGGAQIAANGTWQIRPPAGFNPQAVHNVTARQFDLAGNSSSASAGQLLMNPAVIHNPSAQISASDANLVGGSVVPDSAATGITVTGSPDFIALSGGSDTIYLAASSYLRLSAAGIGFITGATGSETILASPGSQTVYGFNPAGGDQFDLRAILAGISVTPSSNALANAISLTVSGSDVFLAITGPNGSDTVRLAGAGAPTFTTLIGENAFVLPMPPS